MLLAEDLLILTIDPGGGLVGDGKHATSRDALARALLVDLIVRGAVLLEKGDFRLVDPLPQSHRLLTEAAHALGDARLAPEKAVARLRRRMWSVRGDLLDGFERLGIVHRLSGGLFGRFGGSRYALQSTQTRGERLARLRRGYDAFSLQDMSAVALALLAEALGLSPYFLSPEQRLKMRSWVRKAVLPQADDPVELTLRRERLAAMLKVLPLE
jgi:hypothetical protein